MITTNKTLFRGGYIGLQAKNIDKGDETIDLSNKSIDSINKIH